jgi:hypothetical protein
MSNSPPLSDFQALDPAALIERFAQGSSKFERRLLDLSDAQLDTCFRPEANVGRWSCRMLLGHIADADLVFAHRMRRAVAEENPVLAVWDENAFIDSGIYGDETTGKRLPVAGHVALIHTLRLWTADWLRTLDAKALELMALHPERGPQSVKLILTYATWHLEHHAWFLSRKLELLLGPKRAE